MLACIIGPVQYYGLTQINIDSYKLSAVTWLFYVLNAACIFLYLQRLEQVVTHPV